MRNSSTKNGVSTSRHTGLSLVDGCSTKTRPRFKGVLSRLVARSMLTGASLSIIVDCCTSLWLGLIVRSKGAQFPARVFASPRLPTPTLQLRALSSMCETGNVDLLDALCGLTRKLNTETLFRKFYKGNLQMHQPSVMVHNLRCTFSPMECDKLLTGYLKKSERRRSETMSSAPEHHARK